jgi:predicted outer membrane repeat protein
MVKSIMRKAVVILAAALIISTLPTSLGQAFAATELPNEGTENTLSAGEYTLSNDAEVSGTYIVNSGTVTVDLNGYTLTDKHESAGPLFKVTGTGSLTVKDGTINRDETVKTKKTSAIKGETGAALDVEGMTISGYTGNDGWNNGGAICADGCSSVNLTNSTFKENSAEYGGAVNDNNSPISVSGCTFSSNSASVRGGAISFVGGKDKKLLTISGKTEFNGNRVSDNGTQGGGAIFCESGTLNITGNSTGAVFKENSAPLGGAVYANNSSVISVSGNVDFSGNSSSATGWDQGGGAFFLQGSTLTVESKKSDGDSITFNGNTAYRGGAITADNSAVTIKSGTFSDNKASVSDSNDTGGGAVYAFGDSLLTIEGSDKNKVTFKGNTTQSCGGAVCAIGSKTANISYTDFEGNRSNKNRWATGGGAIFVGGTRDLTFGAGTVLKNNVALSSGGGLLFHSSGKFTMNGADITDNKALIHEGGGLSLISGKSVINSGTITGNTTGYAEVGESEEDGESEYKYTDDNGEEKDYSDWGGGGIFVSDQGAVLSIPGISVIQDNDAMGFGGGVAGCGTGRLYMFTDKDNGALVNNNRAKGEHISGSGSAKNEDHTYAKDNSTFMNGGYRDIYFGLAGMLSKYRPGYTAPKNWESGKDWNADWSGSVDHDQYSDETANKNDGFITSTFTTGLTAGNTKGLPDGKTASVTITGNKSYSHGGGILVNGYLFTGQPKNFELGKALSLNGTKILTDAANKDSEGKEKELTGSDKSGFTFKAYKASEKTAFNETTKKFSFDESDKVSNGKTDAAGNITFDDPLEFDSTTVGKLENGDVPSETSPKKMTFYVVENTGSDAYIGYDRSVYKLEVKVYAQKDEVITPNDERVYKTTYRFKTGDTWGTSNKTECLRITKYTLKKDGTYEAGTPTTARLDRAWSEDGNTWDESHIANMVLDKETELKNLKFSNSVYPKPEKHYQDIKVKKVWDDADNADSIRPDSVTVSLYADGKKVEDRDAVLSADNDWTYTWKNLPQEDGSKDIEYTVKEEKVPAGYTAEVTGSEKDGFTVTNTEGSKVIVKNASVKIRKTNGKREIKGAKFGLYSDRKCTKLIAKYKGGTFRISTADKALAEYLPSSGSRTFYLREIKAPSGYHKSSRVYAVKVKASSSKSVKSGVLVKKTVYKMSIQDKKAIQIKNKKIVKKTPGEKDKHVKKHVKRYPGGPKTGDSSDLPVWITLAAAAGVLAAVLRKLRASRK